MCSRCKEGVSEATADGGAGMGVPNRRPGPLSQAVMESAPGTQLGSCVAGRRVQPVPQAVREGGWTSVGLG